MKYLYPFVHVSQDDHVHCGEVFYLINMALGMVGCWGYANDKVEVHFKVVKGVVEFRGGYMYELVLK